MIGIVAASRKREPIVITQLAQLNTISNLGGSTGVMTSTDPLPTFLTSSDGTSGSAVRPRIMFNALTNGFNYRIIITPISKTGTPIGRFFDGSTYITNTYDFSSVFTHDFIASGTHRFVAIDGTNVFSSEFTISLYEI